MGVYEIVGAVVASTVVGTISGLFGVGGGFLLSPLLNVFLGIPIPRAVGSTATLILAVSSSNLAWRRGRGLVDWHLVLTLTGGMLPGIALGISALEALKKMQSWSVAGHVVNTADFVTLSLFTLLLTTIGVYILWDLYRSHGGTPERRVGLFAAVRIPPYAYFTALDEPRLSLPVVCYFALLIGVLSGMMSIGGVVLVPSLIYLVGMRTHKAVGASVVWVWISGFTATAGHAWVGNVDPALMAALLTGGTLGAQLGWQLHVRFTGLQLRRYFAIVVLLTAGLAGWKLLRMLGAP